MKFFRYISVLILILLFTVSLKSHTFAIETIGREDIGIDETLSEESNIYSFPQKIYITQIKGFNSELNNNPQEWLQLLYYYSITRLNLNDIPFNYLIDQNGRIYEGSKGGVGVNPSLEGGENVVLIGVMDNKVTLSPRTESSLKEFVEQLSYRYGINNSWDVVDLTLKSMEDSFSFLKASTSNATLKNSLNTLFKDVKWSTKEHLDYQGKIESVEYPKEVVIGERLKVEVTIKNENDFAWFTTPNYIYISTKDSKESIHAINNEWKSFSKPAYISQEVVKADDSIKVTFDLLAKSKPAKYQESFYFMKSSDNVVGGSTFDIEFNIIKGDNRIVEIVSPEYGFVNIRECRRYSCEKVEVGNDGDVFVTTKKEEGWYEIVYGDDKKGWIYQKYAREL